MLAYCSNGPEIYHLELIRIHERKKEIFPKFSIYIIKLLLLLLLINLYYSVFNLYYYISFQSYSKDKKTMAYEGAADCEILIYLLIYLNKSAYMQLITVLVYGNSSPKSHEQDYLNLQQKL